MDVYSIPILFITFARPDYAQKVFCQIKKTRPRKLYFYSNKARPNNPDEIKNNLLIRDYIHEIDWPCELKLFFREKHVDVFTSVLSALDWIFENEEEAIVLEEDCVPSLAFFDFCRQLLPLYRDDIRVWLISGDNYFPEYNPSGYDYIFSRYSYQYGWASWRSRWIQVRRSNIPFKEMVEYKLYHQLFPGNKEASMRQYQDEKAYRYIQNKPCWDYLFGFAAKMNGGFGIIPKINLVSNIGVSGFHNSKAVSYIHNLPVSESKCYEINCHPPFVVPDYRYDRYFYSNFGRTQSLVNLFHYILILLRGKIKYTLRLLGLINDV